MPGTSVDGRVLISFKARMLLPNERVNLEERTLVERGWLDVTATDDVGVGRRKD